ncbi:MAG: hypothetical protein ABSF22_24855, partial [Bryobacteraceae bacterium]
RIAPDSTVARLEIALANEAEKGGPMADVHGLIAREAAERRVRRAVFGPLSALCGVGGSTGVRFPRRVIAQLWDALRVTQPDLVSAAQRAWARELELPPEPLLAWLRCCSRADRKLSSRREPRSR